MDRDLPPRTIKRSCGIAYYSSTLITWSGIPESRLDPTRSARRPLRRSVRVRPGPPQFARAARVRSRVHSTPALRAQPQATRGWTGRTATRVTTPHADGVAFHAFVTHSCTHSLRRTLLNKPYDSYYVAYKTSHACTLYSLLVLFTWHTSAWPSTPVRGSRDTPLDEPSRARCSPHRHRRGHKARRRVSSAHSCRSDKSHPRHRSGTSGLARG